MPRMESVLAVVRETISHRYRRRCIGIRRNLLMREKYDNDHVHRELTSTRRENHWKEQQLLRREREITRSTRIASMVDGIRNLKYLLSEFDAINNTFWKWKHLLELLKNLYQLDDNFIKNFNKFKFKKRRALIHFC